MFQHIQMPPLLLLLLLALMIASGSRLPKGTSQEPEGTAKAASCWHSHQHSL
jgi:hypothetical protein